ncbi:MAG TPA: hypothetical protein ENK43_10705 [Planctomycetes bacterium]|nr:hypothetical protein [Planctomycetota bacterium]
MLSLCDQLIIGGYLLIVAGVGFFAGRGRKSTDEYILGGHRIPWWAAGLSIIATETSALTFIGAPTQSLRGDWTYLQTTLGSVLARFLVAALLIGIYYRARVFTVYDWLETRFGGKTRGAATALFLFGRCLGSGVRLYGASIALWVVTGGSLGFESSILLIALAAIAYTLFGGIKAVIWTDVLQGFLLVGGGIAAVIVLGASLGDDPASVWQQVMSATAADGASKTRIFDFSFDPTTAYTFWAGLIGITVLTLATHGTDQDMVQRALTCRDAQAGKRSLWLSAFLALPIAFIFLLVGTLLYLVLGGEQGAAALAGKIAVEAGASHPSKGFDYIFPYFAVHEFPSGVRGLIIAGIFAAAMSSLDSAISALASTTVTNVWKRWLVPGRDDSYYLGMSRRFTVFFGALLAVLAFIVWKTHDTGDAGRGFGILMLGLKVLTWIFPPLLGVFLLGALTGRGSDWGGVVALAAGIAVLLVVEFSESLFGTPPPWAWTWNPPIGFVVSFLVGACFGPHRTGGVS